MKAKLNNFSESFFQFFEIIHSKYHLITQHFFLYIYFIFIIYVIIYYILYIYYIYIIFTNYHIHIFKPIVTIDLFF